MGSHASKSLWPESLTSGVLESTEPSGGRGLRSAPSIFGGNARMLQYRQGNEINIFIDVPALAREPGAAGTRAFYFKRPTAFAHARRMATEITMMIMAAQAWPQVAPDVVRRRPSP
jgi:hypothetical protein